MYRIGVASYSCGDIVQLNRGPSSCTSSCTQGKYKEALPFLERSLFIREKALDPEHPDLTTSLNDLTALWDIQVKCSTIVY